MSLAEGFALYLKSKQHLRKDSFNDIRYLGNRLSRAKPELVERNFSELSASECEEWLNAGQTKSGGIFSRVCNVFAETEQSLCVNGKPAYKAALFSGKCFYAERGENGFEDRHIVMAQNLRISELLYDDIVGNSQEANSPSMLKMLQNFTSATFRWASAGFKIADDETLAKRQAICDTCQYWKASARLGMGKCLKCGCTSLKLKFDTEKCPTGKW